MLFYQQRTKTLFKLTVSRYGFKLIGFIKALTFHLVC